MNEQYELHTGDMRVILPTLAADSFDSAVTDPPYLINFMNRKWDRSGISAQVQTWQEVYRVLKPGGYLLAFAACRTYHRIACAIEDAGFEIMDSAHWFTGQGYPKSKNSLKPAHEPVAVARKPFAGTVAENMLQHGTGGLNIDACRIGDDAISAHGGGLSRQGLVYGGGKGLPAVERGANPHVGRWPANVLLDVTAADVLDLQSGTLKSGAWDGNRNREKFPTLYGEFTGQPEAPRQGDEGGASRFFPVFDYDDYDLWPFQYVAKATQAERHEGTESGNTHPTIKPLSIMRWLSRLVTRPGGLVLDPFMGSGSTGVAALMEGFRFVGIEQEEEFAQIAAQRIAQVKRAASSDVLQPRKRTAKPPPKIAAPSLFDSEPVA